MKFTLILLLLVQHTLYSCTDVHKSAVGYEQQITAFQGDSGMLKIQHKIHRAFSESLISKYSAPLDSIEKNLNLIAKKNNFPLIIYWQSYLLYYKAIYFLVQNDKKNSMAVVETAILNTEKMDKKNSEDYALLALMQSFSIQFKTGMGAGIVSARVKENAQRAIEIDSANLRGYYAYGSNDFYTPQKYGGGKEAEKYLLKTISLKDQKIANDYLPSWGKEEAYELLIKFYLKNENKKMAKHYFREAHALYPDSYRILKLAPYFVE